MVVVGGGPAGAAAAITLARAGRHVVLVDKARFPRDKFCGDGLTTGALRLLEQLGLTPAAVTSWRELSEVVVRSPSGRSATFSFPVGQGSFAAVARRADLDAALVDVAREAGVEVHEGVGVTGAEERPDRVVVTVGVSETIHARYAVGADGMWSPLRKLLGMATDGYRGESHAFRQYFTGVGPEAAKNLFLWFEDDLLPGYAWSFPLPDGRANVGFGIHRNGRGRVGDMGRLWADLLARPHIRGVLGAEAAPEAPHRAWPIPSRLDQCGLATVGGRVLFVGDAAAAADPLTGEGIGQALLTGVGAAAAIDATGPFGAGDAAHRYRSFVLRELSPDHRMSSLLLPLLRGRRRARVAVRAAGATPWTRRNFARWLFEDYPRAVLVTPRRWRRGMLSGPGAYPIATPPLVRSGEPRPA